MSDILDLLDENNPVPKEEIISEKEPAAKPNFKGKSKGKNMWEEEDIEPKQINNDSLSRFNRMVVFTSLGEIDDITKVSVDELARELYGLGFTLRVGGDKEDDISKLASSVFKGKEQIMLPWKKFNPDLDGTITKPTDDAYYHAAFHHKAFKKVPPAVRAIIARTVNMVVGEDCKTSLNMLVCYTKDGAETVKEVDYTTTGNLSFIITLCGELNIPVFNLGKPDAKTRALEYIKTFQN